jgi:hypothetical protein
MEKGSILILAIITVLIMSVMILGLLSIGSTEVRTTRNYQLKKMSFYHAVQSLETVIEQVRNAEDPTTIKIDKITAPPLDADGTRKNYYTGNMATGGAAVSVYKGIQTPQLVGISLGTETGYVPVMYRIPIVAEVTSGSKTPACTEIEAGVYALMKDY